MSHLCHILGVHPSSKGFGYALFDAPLSLVDWGLVRASDNAEVLMRLENLLSSMPVQHLVLEEYKGARRNARIEQLCISIIATAHLKRIPVRVMTRASVAACFTSTKATTREEIAHAVSKLLPELAPRLPPPRKPWMSEDSRLALFSAAALPIAHFAHPQEELSRHAA